MFCVFRGLKWLVILVILLPIAGFYVWFFHTFHPARLGVITSATGLSQEEKVVQAAKSLQGILYDYSGGRLLRFGLLVCTDVPRLSYQAAGIDIGSLMAADYKRHPDHYSAFPGNNPSTSYFDRRVENQKVFFSDTGRLIRNCTAPEPGDSVFYGSSHVTMVLAVYPDHTYDEIETAPGTCLATVHYHKKWTPRDVGRFKRLTQLRPGGKGLLNG
ncbi:yijf periplasmic ecs4873 precursor cc1379 signal domain pm0035 [Acididesulfobacillus acetoxydans]|uniref:Yijf periplasmic ecs4873 cc1379 signal domain pm0035 n=1 Tax=Acididesulfobacillus acetoxydans TaxID=1561005 RepID=A0A8S0VY43_9FIRM|nr:DUF1287 domain-containing protein [Acididesulfobacillus acetoxydans]CAA7602583.1 yijf periplasmic ecs4873 precursor cc1379 signal domain pm0035 [Acididesulfobacillus acetoxydans]CEJ07271.1 Domain of unknown function (DUF1287) [Acididesulfobacillus acetoxydans]